MISGVSAQKCASARLAQSHCTALYNDVACTVDKLNELIKRLTYFQCLYYQIDNRVNVSIDLKMTLERYLVIEILTLNNNSLCV